MAMSVVPLPPGEVDLVERLGGSYPAYQQLLGECTDLRPEWKYYGPRLGWTLKMFEKRRNLCFVTPGDGCFSVSFVLGEAAVREALASRLPGRIKTQIKEARQYVEGRPVKVSIKFARELGPVRTLLGIKRDR